MKGIQIEDFRLLIYLKNQVLLKALQYNKLLILRHK